jgi:hypothetical protein
VQQAAQHGQAHVGVLPPWDHQRAGQRHGLHRMVEGFGPRGLAGRQQQLRHRMQRQVGRLLHQLGARGLQQRRPAARAVQQASNASTSVAVVTPSSAIRQLSSGLRSWRSSSLRCSAVETGMSRAHSLMPEMSKMSREAMMLLVCAGLQDGGQRMRVGGGEMGGGFSAAADET